MKPTAIGVTVGYLCFGGLVNSNTFSEVDILMCPQDILKNAVIRWGCKARQDGHKRRLFYLSFYILVFSRVTLFFLRYYIYFVSFKSKV